MADPDRLPGARPAWLDNKDVCAGLFFAAVGAAALYVARDYPVGTSLDMGPGYFPTLLGGLLVLLGLINIGRGLRAREARRVSPLAWRPWMLVAGGVMLFGLLIDHQGLVAAIVAVVLVSRIGGRAMQPLEIAAICVVLAVIAGLLFLYGLGLPFSTLLPQ